MWTPAHNNHALSPADFQNLRSATANVRPTTARSPLSQYQKGSGGALPVVRRRIRSATYSPCCMAGCASPGNCTAVPLLRPSRLRVLAITNAVSPMAKISACPGTDRLGLTFTLPDLSASAPSQRAAGEAATPAVHITV